METFDLFLQNVVFRGFYEFYHKVDVAKYSITRKGGAGKIKEFHGNKILSLIPCGVLIMCEHPIFNSELML